MHKPDSPVLRKPDWIRVKAPVSREYQETRALMRRLKLNTVCEEAACPNIGECWKQRHATVMILGSVCTRACAFCNVATGRPDRLDPHEPDNVAYAVGELQLSHVVVTSVVATISRTAAPSTLPAPSAPFARFRPAQPLRC